MTIAVVITGLSDYRVLGPIVAGALARGWQVECWHDYGRRRSGLKSYLFPAVERAPLFEEGRPVVRAYQSPAELAAWARRDDLAAIVALRTPPPELEPRGGARPAAWMCVQLLVDTFMAHGPRALASADILAIQSEWWLEWATEYWRACGAGDEVRAVRDRAVCVGWPEVEILPAIDPGAVRHRWGIPSGQPVVVYLPFPQGVGTSGFWPKKVFIEPRRARRMVNVILARQWQHWRDAWSGPTEAAVLRAVREFCTREGAFLLVKSREKTPVLPYVAAAADSSLYDESHYPATILEALRVADLCVGFYSLTALEAAAAGVPNLCVRFDLDRYAEVSAAHREYLHRFCLPARSVFAFDGVSTAVDATAAIALLKTRTLADLAIDPRARQDYLDTFVGPLDGLATARTLDALARCATPN